MLDEEDQSLFAQVILGEEAEAFWQTNLGRYVSGRISQDIKEGLDDLKYVNPTNTEDIRMIQTKIGLAESLPKYLNELIINGRQSLEILEGA